MTSDNPVSASARPRRRPGENRERLIEAGLIEFGLFGYHGASTAGIAARAEVPQPHLYASFPSKRDLFLATVRRLAQRAAQERWAAGTGWAAPRAADTNAPDVDAPDVDRAGLGGSPRDGLAISDVRAELVGPGFGSHPDLPGSSEALAGSGAGRRDVAGALPDGGALAGSDSLRDAASGWAAPAAGASSDVVVGRLLYQAVAAVGDPEFDGALRTELGAVRTALGVDAFEQLLLLGGSALLGDLDRTG